MSASPPPLPPSAVPSAQALRNFGSRGGGSVGNAEGGDSRSSGIAENPSRSCGMVVNPGREWNSGVKIRQTVSPRDGVRNFLKSAYKKKQIQHNITTPCINRSHSKTGNKKPFRPKLPYERVVFSKEKSRRRAEGARRNFFSVENRQTPGHLS